jgi:hypothetical protein
VLVDEKAVAVTQGRCLGRDPDGWHLLSTLGEPPEHELHLWLDDAGQPTKAQLRTALATADYEIRDRSIVVRMHGDAYVVDLDPPRRDVWILPAHALYLREAMLRLGVGRDADGIRQLGLAPETGTIAALSLTEDGGTLVGDGGRLRFSTTPGASTLEQLRLERVLAGDVPIYEAIEAPARLVSSLPEIPRPHYVTRDGLRREPVEIPADGSEPRLAAELVVRAGDDRRRAAALFLSTSGLQDRFGFVPGTSIDLGTHELSDALAAAGLAVLRFDDRGVGESARGEDPTPGFLAQVDDARRALAVLARRPEVDPRKIVLVGHGEGALVATILATERVRPAALVLLSPAGRDARTLIRWQLERELTEATAIERERALAALDAIHDAVVRDAELPAASEPMRDWMREIFAEDPLRHLARVRAPVLAIAGDRDFQTDPALDLQPIADRLARRRDSQTRLFPGLDHLLKPEPGRSTVGHYGDLSRRVDPAAIAFVVDWIAARVG